MSGTVTREQLVALLREHGFAHKRQCDRVDFWKQRGSALRVAVPRRDHIPLVLVTTIVRQAGIPQEAAREFLAGCVKG